MVDEVKVTTSRRGDSSTWFQKYDLDENPFEQQSLIKWSSISKKQEQREEEGQLCWWWQEWTPFRKPRLWLIVNAFCLLTTMFMTIPVVLMVQDPDDDTLRETTSYL